MAKMKMTKVFEASLKDVFEEFILDKTANGTSEKTLETYRSHFHSLSKWLDTDTPIDELTDKQLKQMVADMRNSTLSPSSIASYIRTLKSFLSWCNTNSKTDVKDIKDTLHKNN